MTQPPSTGSFLATDGVAVTLGQGAYVLGRRDLECPLASPIAVTLAARSR